MSFLRRQLLQGSVSAIRLQGWRGPGRLLSLLLAVLSCWIVMGTSSAMAGLHDDRFDGDIFALYAGNGSLVPPRVTLAEAFQRKRPILLVFYIDDSRDCKEYSLVISQLQQFYGKAAEFMPFRVDALPSKGSNDPTEPGYYYRGLVPQTILFDTSGKIVLNEIGQVPFEQIDDVFREVFDLLPRSESVELKRRSVNELTTELVN
ncbi:MAG: thylakoid membrane photosystem I accumulation factor [Leptolyngbyaceae cyanobacterium HOT.MB2.61]|jgi:hypothetical protein|nr:thylakoid membrane photosystem I accumulation factor [Leptolyngbyaceae cyanobacterium HOT.MB2.61]